MSQFRHLPGRTQAVEQFIGLERDFVPTDPPAGYRWKTLLEYRIEYLNPNTTAARRQQIIAIRCRLLPQETVELPSDGGGPIPD